MRLPAITWRRRCSIGQRVTERGPKPVGAQRVGDETSDAIYPKHRAARFPNKFGPTEIKTIRTLAGAT